MAIKQDYSVGTASIANGTNVITFAGGANLNTAAIQPGDEFKVQNLDAVIVSISTNGLQATIAGTWTGATLSAATYRIRYQPDGSRYTAAARDLIDQLGNGSVAALQSVTGATDKLPYFVSSSTMGVADFTAMGRDVVGSADLPSLKTTMNLLDALTANRNYYVNSTTGNDTNNGRSASTPFKNISRAISQAYSSIDMRNYQVVINVADGTYAESLTCYGQPNNSGGTTIPIKIVGNIASPANVVITGQPHCLAVYNGARIDIHGFKLNHTSGYGIYTSDPGTWVNFGNIIFGQTSLDHVISQSWSLVTIDASYSIVGGALNHFHATESGCIKASGAAITITLVGNPAFTGQFCGCAWSNIFLPNVTFSGTATGRKYLVHYNGAIRGLSTNGTVFPGDQPGIEEAGGRNDYTPSFTAHKNGIDQTGIVSGNDNWVTFDTSVVVGNGYSSTSGAWQPRGGKCSISATVTFTGGLSAGQIMGIGIYKNGQPYKYVWDSTGAASVQGVHINLVDYCTGNDVYQIFARCDGPGTRTISGAPSFTWWCGTQLS